MNNCRLFNLHSEIVTRVEKVGVIKKKKNFHRLNFRSIYPLLIMASGHSVQNNVIFQYIHRFVRYHIFF